MNNKISSSKVSPGKKKKSFLNYRVLIIVILGFSIIGGIIYIGIDKYSDYRNEQVRKEEEQQKLTTEQQAVLEEAKQEIEKLKSKSEQSEQKQDALEQKISSVENAQPIEPETKNELSTPEIVSANKKFIVSVMCETRDGYSFGSGIIVGKSYYNKLLVLTNYHVTKGFYSSKEGQPPCIVGLESAPPHLAEPTMFPKIVSQETMETEDWSFLEIRDPISSGDNQGSLNYAPIIDQYKTFPQICAQNELSAGAEIVALGYPSIGSETFMGGLILQLITTEGIISSEPETWQHYFVSSAKIERGNSGGGAFLKRNGCLAGMPTFVNVGEIESLARFINLPNLKVSYSGIFNYIQR